MADLTFRSDKGSPLTVEECDDNIHNLDDRVTAIEENPPAANGISNIVVDGTQMTIVLEDATELGPYTLPQANFRPTEEKEIEFSTDGTYELIAADANRYLHSEAGGTILIGSDVGMTANGEVVIRQVGASVIGVEWPTDVDVRVPAGFLPQTAGQGCAISLKWIASKERWDMDGVLAADS